MDPRVEANLNPVTGETRYYLMDTGPLAIEITKYHPLHPQHGEVRVAKTTEVLETLGLPCRFEKDDELVTLFDGTRVSRKEVRRRVEVALFGVSK